VSPSSAYNASVDSLAAKEELGMRKLVSDDGRRRDERVVAMLERYVRDRQGSVAIQTRIDSTLRERLPNR